MKPVLQPRGMWLGHVNKSEHQVNFGPHTKNPSAKSQRDCS